MSFIPTHPRSVAKLFLITITGFGIICVAALAAVRLDHLQPETTVFLPSVFGQLLSVHRVLLQYFVLLPALPAIIGFAMLPALTGSERLAFPRMALAAWAMFTLGGCLVLWAFLGASINANWAQQVGMASPLQTGSTPFLLGLILGTLAIGLVAINLLASIHMARTRPSPILAACLYGACALQLLALPMVGSALMLSLGAHWGVLTQPGLGSDPTLFATLPAMAARPLKISILLAAMGVAATLLSQKASPSAGQMKRIKIYVTAVVIASFLAFETRAMPGVVSPNMLLTSSLFSVMLLAPLCALMFTLFGQHLRVRPAGTTAHIYAVAVAVLIFLLAPIDVLLQLPGLHSFADTYLASTIDYMLVLGSAMLATAGALHRLCASNPHSGKRIAGCIIVGLGIMVLPMIPMGLGGISMDFAIYPREVQPLQVMSAYGGLLLAIALATGIVQLFLQSLRSGHVRQATAA